MWNVLTSWITVVVVIPILITIGIGVLSMTPPEFTTAHICFTLSAAILMARLGWWLAFEQPASKIQLFLFAFIIFGIIGCLWLFSMKWITQREQKFVTATTQPKQPTVELKEKLNNGKTKTLRELFLTDFNKTHMLAEYHLMSNKKVAYTVEYIIWGDFDTKTLFYSIFFPKSDYTFDACRFLIPKYKELLSGNIRSLMKGIIHQAPGSKAESWDELSFSGRIYIYHETRLLPDRIQTLMEEYRKADLHPQFRGRDYLIMKNSPLYEEGQIK